ncbi:MAG TPA: MaoC family dehydratase [Dehalococcoidia bacterium]|nr:MaoC family dehydratase [Dehalococcoidia bacterium]
MPLRSGPQIKLMVCAEIEVGEELPELDIASNEEMQGRYMLAVGDENPWYYTSSPWVDPITHHSLYDDAPMEATMLRYQYPFGFVHAKQETEFINPLPLGKPAKAYTKIVDKYEKRGKVYIVTESLIKDEDGVEIMRSRFHAMIEDERVKEASRFGIDHVPPSITFKYRRK